MLDHAARARLEQLPCLLVPSLPVQEKLSNACRLREYGRNDRLCHQGDRPGALYFVMQGLVDLESVRYDGRVVQHRRAFDGDIIGLPNVIEPHMHLRRYAATAICKTTAEIAVVSGRNLDALLKHQDFHRFASRYLAREHLLNDIFHQNVLAAPTVGERVATWLLYDQSIMRKKVPDEPLVYGPHAWMAGHLLTTRESVSRSLSILRRQGIVSKARGRYGSALRLERPDVVLTLASGRPLDMHAADWACLQDTAD